MRCLPTSLQTLVFSFVLVFGLAILAAPHLTYASSITPNSFSTTWNTQNPGTSANNQITIPGSGTGYNYTIYWEDTASSSIHGTTSAITSSYYTLTFPQPGTYRVDISGTFPRIFFNNGGDKDKLLSVNQWGNIAWTNMIAAFKGCTNLNFTATDTPDLSNVTDMSYMFYGATSFNSNIDNWNVSHVTNMGAMFQNATSFNQPLDAWNIASVTSLTNTFQGATAFNQPLNNWNTANVTSLSGTFAWATAFNQPLSNWNTANVTSLYATFWNATSFDQPIGNWDVSKVTNMWRTFRSAAAFNQPLDSWSTSKVTNMIQTFAGIEYPVAFNQPLDKWNTASVTSMVEMFAGNNVFDQDLSNWNVTGIVTYGAGWTTQGLYRMFGGTGSGSQATAKLSQKNLDATLAAWAAEPVQSGVKFNLGLKTYSGTGAAAIASLETNHNWTINQQYEVKYAPGLHASLIGNGDQIVSSHDPYVSSTTTPVTIVPDQGYRFIEWSDGSTANPRTDVPHDNETYTAIVQPTGIVIPGGGGGVSSARLAQLQGAASSSSPTKTNPATKTSDTNSTATTTITTAISSLQRYLSQPIPTDATAQHTYLVTLVIKLSQLVVELLKLVAQQQG